MRIAPITYSEACEYVNKYHRHNKAPQGCKFCIALYDGDQLCGVAICGRPVSRCLDNGYICEITRVCTDGTRNACSMLYGACVRIAREMGYDKVVTYTLASEDGASVKAANFKFDGEAGSICWRGTRNSGKDVPHEMKKRWVFDLRGERRCG